MAEVCPLLRYYAFHNNRSYCAVTTEDSPNAGQRCLDFENCEFWKKRQAWWKSPDGLYATAEEALAKEMYAQEDKLNLKHEAEFAALSKDYLRKCRDLAKKHGRVF